MANWNTHPSDYLGLVHYALSGITPVFASWFALAGKAALLGIEAQSVIALRFTRLVSGGPRSQAEAMRMVTDKLTALAEVQIIVATAAVTGQSADVIGEKILRKYKKRVGANRRRLLRR